MGGAGGLEGALDEGKVGDSEGLALTWREGKAGGNPVEIGEVVFSGAVAAETAES